MRPSKFVELRPHGVYWDRIYLPNTLDWALAIPIANIPDLPAATPVMGPNGFTGGLEIKVPHSVNIEGYATWPLL